jgi:hypothetical protein
VSYRRFYLTYEWLPKDSVRKFFREEAGSGFNSLNCVEEGSVLFSFFLLADFIFGIINMKIIIAF